MFIINSKTSDEKKVKGKWFPWEDGLELLIASTKVPEFKSGMESLIQGDRATYRKWIDFLRGNIVEYVANEDEKKIEAFTKKVQRLVCNHIIKDWKGMFETEKCDEEESGYRIIKVPFSSENAYRLMDLVPVFFAKVYLEATKEENFSLEIDAEVMMESEKNLSSVSSGI